MATAHGIAGDAATLLPHTTDAEPQPIKGAKPIPLGAMLYGAESRIGNAAMLRAHLDAADTGTPVKSRQQAFADFVKAENL